MHFEPTPIEGAFLVDLDRRGDDRGFFARVFCAREFAAAGLAGQFVQINTSFSGRRGTLRGLHHQLPPAAEAKLVRCIQGALFDVVLDLRPASPSFRRWFGAELTAANRRMMYVPEGCAHGFLSLADGTETLYLASAFYQPDAERGIRFDDPAFAIDWPMAPVDVSAKDRAWPDYRPASAAP